MRLIKLLEAGKTWKLYRGIGPTSKTHGSFWTPDKEFARNFTQSGRDHEILKIRIPDEWIYEADELPYGGDFDAINELMEKLQELEEESGDFYIGFWCSEGGNYEHSVYMLHDPRDIGVEVR